MKVVLLDQNNRVEEVPDEQVQEGFVQGRYGFVPGSRVPIYRSDSNEYGTMSAEEARDTILGNSGRIATHAERSQSALEREHGGVGSSVAAVAESAADAATLGLYSGAAGLISPQYEADIEARREALPTEATAGTVIGTTVPLLIPGAGEVAASSAATRAGLGVARAATAPIRATAALGRLAEGATARLVGEGAASAAGRVAQRLAPTIAGGAAEGAAIAGAQTVSESLLGDQELSAEHLLANMGLGAATGGVAGAALTGLGLAGAAGARATGRGVRNLYERATGSPLSQAIAERYLRMAAPGGQRELLETFLSGAGAKQARRAVTESADSAIANATRGVRNSLDNVSAVDNELTSLVRRSDPESLGKLVSSKHLPEQVNAHANAIRNVEGRLTELETAGIFQPKVVAQARQALDDLPLQIRKAGPDNFGSALYSRTTNFRRILDDLADAADDRTGQALRGISDDLGQHLGLEDVWGRAATASKELDTVVAKVRSSADNLRSSGIEDPQFIRTVQNLDTDSRLSALADHANNQKAALDILRKYGGDEKALAGLRSKLDSADLSSNEVRHLLKDQIVNSNRWSELQRLENARQQDLFFDPSNLAGAVAFSLGGPKAALAAKYATSALVAPTRGISLLARLEQAQNFIAKKIDKGVQQWATVALEKSAKGVRRAVSRVASINVNDFDSKAQQYSNPDFGAGVQASTSQWEAEAPNTAALFASKASQAAAEVQRRLPQPLMQSGSLMPPRQAIPVSKAEKIKWLRFTRAAENPMTMLEDLENRALSPEGVDAVKTLYPRLFESVVTKIQQHLATAKKLPSYEDRLQLGILLGVPTDPSLNPQQIMSNQISYQISQQTQTVSGGIRYSTQLISPEQTQTKAQQIARQDL